MINTSEMALEPIAKALCAAATDLEARTTAAARIHALAAPECKNHMAICNCPD